MSLTRMLNNFVDQLAILDISPDLFGHRALEVVGIIRIILGWQHNVDTGAFARKDLRVEALVAEVDLSSIDLIQQDGGEGAENLKCKIRALDNIDRRHKIV